MGLDIYLYKYENPEETQRREKLYEKQSEANWNEHGEYNTLADPIKEEVRAKNKKLAREIGLSDDGTDETFKKCIEMDSLQFPEHYFKVGYFRSSYNGSGINRILENMGVPDLYDIFDNPEEYCFRPNWEAALKRCTKAIKQLEKKGNYRCFDISSNIFGSQQECSSEKQALEIFIEEISRKDSGGFTHYSNGKGHFYHSEPLKVLAMITGTNNILQKNVPCTYVVIEGDNTFYIQALKIVKETIEWVLSQPDKEKYCLHWSG